MRKIVLRFLLFIVLYHCIVTYVSFGQAWIPPYGILLARDVGRLLFAGAIALRYRRSFYACLLQWYRVRMVCLILFVVGIISSIVLGVDVQHIMVGMKYSLYYIIPFLSALFIGYVRKDLYTKEDFTTWILRVRRIFVGVLIVGRAWQIAKNIWPDFFMHFGYGPLGDYVYGQKPPLYYLTGPRGFQRRSGLFSGPNNYGYLLVVLFGLYRYGIKAFIKQKGRKILLRTLYIVTLAATMSRGAILGVLLEVLLISYVVYQAKRRIIVAAIIAGLLAVAGLSLMKRQSTLAHVQAKLSSLQYIQQAPRGYGLGSSGPSIHSQGGILPENFFIQLLMDLGIHGFIIRGWFWLMVMIAIRAIYRKNPVSRTLLFFLSVGFVGIMFEGLFLHVLEDSMVNYIYFIVRGIIVGYKSAPSVEMKQYIQG